MLVTLITPTGGRPEAWALCQKYIAAQTYKGPIQWIVINDCPDVELPQSGDLLACKNIKMEIYTAVKLWRPEINTQRYNMDQALPYVKGDFVFTIEDDDCYMPNYIEMMLFFLQRFDIVGQANSRYYNIKDRAWKEWRNYTHTSLCETALRKSKLDLLDRAVNSGQLYFDVILWQIVKNEKHNNLLFDHIGLICGMKGLPGKKGIGGGHFPDKSFTRDPFFEKLKEWVGPVYAKGYMDLVTTVKK